MPEDSTVSQIEHGDEHRLIVRPGKKCEWVAALEILYQHHPAEARSTFVEEIVAADAVGTFPLDDLVVAIRNRRVVGTGLIAIVPGRTALVWPSRCSSDVAAHVKFEVAREMNRVLDSANVGFGQCLMSPDHGEDDVLVAIGLRHALDLQHLRLTMTAGATDDVMATAAESVRLTTVAYTASDFDRFACVLEATYAGSADSPEIAGLRSADDALEGHQSAGVFRDDLSSIVRVDGRDAGLILIADHGDDPNLAGCRTAELLYIGLIPEVRGRGLGKRFLRHTLRELQQAGFGSISVAVDTRNLYAIRLYRDLGFVSCDLQEVWLYRPGQLTDPQ